jgi:LacI family transcriptional regulator
MKGGTWVDRTILIKPAGVETRRSTDTLAIDDRVVADALQYVRQHACEGVTVEDVAKRAHVSRRLLQNRFKDAVGRTMREELLLVRLNQARFLLEHAGMSIAEVAVACGFKHHAYFGKIFKREIGVTPLTYRQQHQHT